MGDIIHLSTLLGLGALLLAAPRFVLLTFRLNVNAAAMNAYLAKLVEADDLDRARKLLRALPSAAYSKVAQALVMRSDELREGEQRPRPEVEAALTDAGARALTGIKAEVWRGRLFDLASLVLLIVGARAATSGWSEIGGGAGGAALLLLLLSLRLSLRIPRQCEQQGQALIAALADHVERSQDGEPAR